MAVSYTHLDVYKRQIQYLVDEDEILDAFPCILHSDSILRQLAFTIH